MLNQQTIEFNYCSKDALNTSDTDRTGVVYRKPSPGMRGKYKVDKVHQKHMLNASSNGRKVWDLDTGLYLAQNSPIWEIV